MILRRAICQPAVHAAQQVLALADQEVGLGLDAVAVDEETALDRDLVGDAPTGVAHHLDVRDHVADARGRLLRPVDAGAGSASRAGVSVSLPSSNQLTSMPAG